MHAIENPIPRSSLWVTPEDLDQLYAMLNEFTGEQASIAIHAMMLTLNTCNKLIDEKIAKC